MQTEGRAIRTTQNGKNNNLIQLSLMQMHKRAARFIRQENNTHAHGLCLKAV